MVKRAIWLQVYALVGNIGIVAFYYWVLRPNGASDNLLIAFAATIPVAYVLSTAMLIFDEMNRNEAGCIGWIFMVTNLFLMALNTGALFTLMTA